MAVAKWRNHENGQANFVGSAYTAGGTSLTVQNGAAFTAPAAGTETLIRVDDEFMVVSAISGNVLTVAGAQDGSAAANHAIGALVFTTLNRSGIAKLRQQMDIETTSGAPASPTYVTPLRLAYDPATKILYLWDGSAWRTSTFV